MRMPLSPGRTVGRNRNGRSRTHTAAKQTIAAAGNSTALDPNRTSRPAVLDRPQTRGIFVLDGGLLDSTLVRVADVASAGMYDYALP
jgi:hypothetical protein